LNDAGLREVREAAAALGLQIQVINASTIGEINAAFAALARERAEALFVTGGAFFSNRRAQLVTLAARDRIPAAYTEGQIAQTNPTIQGYWAQDTVKPCTAHRRFGLLCARRSMGRQAP
jgi:hypothetical protein